ncbi:MAG: tocopherol cyclase family protein [Gemmatimonadaceae bacterium]|nr:tocopherol cyclase family protein [Gloeobacterales cyanobacterium ES-bin-141]
MRAQLSHAVLNTPHAGFHWPGGLWQSRDRRFFEGWYYRVSLPECGESFAFMYSIEDLHGSPTSGGFAQVLGPGDVRIYTLLPVQGFWASPTQLALGHWSGTEGSAHYLDPEKFAKQVEWGYQATDTLNQGSIRDEHSGEVVQWHYRIRPVYGWGRAERPRATMELLSYLPVFEPGWQILMAYGLAEGWIEWRGERYEFTDAPAYGEKNWGGAFPSKWFWVQANQFDDSPGTALVAGGGLRGVLWWEESVAMVGLYHQGQFYNFMPSETEIDCAILPWGRWQISAASDRYRIDVTGKINAEGGIDLLAPTRDGPRFVCRDTLLGEVNVRLARRRGNREILFEGSTRLGGLETGGGPWPEEWCFSC